MKYGFSVRLLGIVRGKSHEDIYNRMLTALEEYPEFKLTGSNLDMWVDGANGTERDFDGERQFDVIIGGVTFGTSLAQVQKDIMTALKRYTKFSTKAVNVDMWMNGAKPREFDDEGNEILPIVKIDEPDISSVDEKFTVDEV